MEITERKQDFLRVVEEIYRETGQPVHYETVAQRLSVSKWTAYDALKDLINTGLLKVEYQRQSAPGRSRITVLPASTEPQWQQKLKDILGVMHELKQKTPKMSLEVLSKDLAGQTKGVFCAYVIAMALLVLRPVLKGQKVLEVIAGGVCPEVILATLGGMLVGSLLKSKSAEDKQTIGYLEDYQRYISEVTEEERKQLVAFLKTAISAIS